MVTPLFHSEKKFQAFQIYSERFGLFQSIVDEIQDSTSMKFVLQNKNIKTEMNL